MFNQPHLVDIRLNHGRIDRDISIYVSNQLENAQLGLSESDIEIVEEAICEKGNGLSEDGSNDQSLAD